MKYVYGPVYSWRLGRSLGVDLLSQDEKICTFDCLYCQIGLGSKHATERKVYAPTHDVIAELIALAGTQADYITFSGRGEPTLAKNLGEVISEVRKIRSQPIAVLTNGSLICRNDVRKDLALADAVACKLDAGSDKGFRIVNTPGPGIEFTDILKGLKDFRDMFGKKLALQVMFIKENMTEAQKIADLARKIKPDEIQINTPLRPTSVDSLSREEVERIKGYFKGFKVISVYDRPEGAVRPVSEEDTLKRRGPRK
ncbi:MAG: radical SAM protein [Candidatus Omnitrophota bacterium]